MKVCHELKRKLCQQGDYFSWVCQLLLVNCTGLEGKMPPCFMFWLYSLLCLVQYFTPNEFLKMSKGGRKGKEKSYLKRWWPSVLKPSHAFEERGGGV